jgi:formate hydrogenlyase subunit 3/multisubunit Na+/H+ antiporter MnhD subunit
MGALAIALLCWAAGAGGAGVLRRRRAGAWLGGGGAVAGALAAGFAGSQTLALGLRQRWDAPFALPIGKLALGLDPLGAVFLLPIALIGALCAIYGVAYLRRHAHGRSIGGSLAAYNVLLLSMALVVTADDLVLLLMAWELMTLSSWALVVSDHDAPAVREAGLRYLVAGHIATAALLILVLVMPGGGGSLLGGTLSPPRGMPPGVLFGLALVGFGTKAGIVPLHVWLPDAHPAAPSHVSALMSAVMITMGFYGLARFIPLLGTPAPWWGYALITLGAAGAAGGIAFAIGQRDVKRLLAYSTIENAGLVTLAMGVALLATAVGEPVLAGVAWTAALLHLWNHALAKALLFLGFGAIAQGAGSRSLDQLGGFLRSWPLVGGVLVLGTAALASLPGLNLFTGEWLLFRGLLGGAVTLSGAARIAAIGGMVAIAATGGLAVLCFARVVGIGLSGSARSSGAQDAPAPGWVMVLPLLFLGAACVAMAVAPGAAAGALHAAVVGWPVDPGTAPALLAPLAWVPPLLAAGVAFVFVMRSAARTGLPARSATWGCAYSAPTPAMQYTGTSFGEPLTRLLQPLLRPEFRYEVDPPEQHGGRGWIRQASWSSRIPDRILAGAYLPVFAAAARIGRRITGTYQPRITSALLFMAAAMLAVLTLLFLTASRP